MAGERHLAPVRQDEAGEVDGVGGRVLAPPPDRPVIDVAAR
jgi:hypothetical protein